MRAQVGHQPFALGRVQGYPFVVVIRQPVIKLQCMLADGPQAIGLCRHGHAGGGVGMDHAMQVRSGGMDGRVDHEPGTIDPVIREQGIHHLAFAVDLHQITGRHMLKEHAIAVDQEVPGAVFQTQGNMGVDQVGHTKMCNQAVQRRQFTARSPFHCIGVLG